MYDVKLRYLASIFVNPSAIESNDRNMFALYRTLIRQSDLDWSPVGINETVKGKQVKRFGFLANDGEWQVVSTNTRINVEKHVDASGQNLGPFKDFCNIAATLIGAALGVFEQSGHRLACVQEGVLHEMTEKQMDRIMSRLFNLPSIFRKSLPFEWQWRVASLINRTFGNKTEPTNTLITAKRARVSVENPENADEIVDIDRIQVDLDINTSQRVKEARFTASDVKEFLSLTPKWHEELEKNFQSFIGGDRK